MIEAERLDLGMSLDYYLKEKDKYESGQCYNNAIAFLLNHIELKDLKVVYGYVLSTDGTRKIAIRHCWNLVNGYHIDVTVFADGYNPVSVLNFGFLPVDIYERNEVFLKIEDNKYLPCLYETENEKRVIEKLKAEDYEVLGTVNEDW